jgi:hypothetical protein
VKCPSCKTKIGSKDYKNDPCAPLEDWPAILVFIIVAGALSEALAFGVALFINAFLDLGTLCLYIVQPIEVTTEPR